LFALLPDFGNCFIANNWSSFLPSHTTATPPLHSDRSINTYIAKCYLLAKDTQFLIGAWASVPVLLCFFCCQRDLFFRLLGTRLICTTRGLASLSLWIIPLLRLVGWTSIYALHPLFCYKLLLLANVFMWATIPIILNLRMHCSVVLGLA